MSIIEKKIDAMLRFCAAETDEARAEALADIRELMQKQSTKNQTAAETNEDVTIRHILLELGVPDHLLGYDYLVTGIAITASNPDVVKGITKNLYPQICKIHHTTVPKVERTIRHAIEVAWDRGDPDVLRKHFGNIASPLKGKTTNKEFIARIANTIRTGV